MGWLDLLRKRKPQQALPETAVGEDPVSRAAAPETKPDADSSGNNDRAEDGGDNRKEKIMDIKGINALIDNLRDNLDDGLLATEISSFKVGSSLAGFNVNGKIGALINKYTKYLIEIINKVGFGTTCAYYRVDISGNKCLFVLVFDEYCWPILVDTAKVAPGMMVSAVIPDCIEAFVKTMK